MIPEFDQARFLRVRKQLLFRTLDCKCLAEAADSALSFLYEQATTRQAERILGF